MRNKKAIREILFLYIWMQGVCLLFCLVFSNAQWFVLLLSAPLLILPFGDFFFLLSSLYMLKPSSRPSFKSVVSLFRMAQSYGQCIYKRAHMYCTSSKRGPRRKFVMYLFFFGSISIPSSKTASLKWPKDSYFEILP